MESIRTAAVAGRFYPADSVSLNQQLASLMDISVNSPARPIKAIIVPHAGYQYSGQTAAQAYAMLAKSRPDLETIILLGPCHRVWSKFVSLPTHTGFQTPLGVVQLNQQLMKRIEKLPGIEFSNAAHKMEHSLEVQLPFVQSTFPKASIVPILVGECSISTVSQVIDSFWDLPKTAFVISSDLSHFHSYDAAKEMDSETTDIITQKRYRQLSPERACGCTPIQGLLAAIQHRPVHVELISQCNSGDTCGDRSKVVGYGSYAIY